MSEEKPKTEVPKIVAPAPEKPPVSAPRKFGGGIEPGSLRGRVQDYTPPPPQEEPYADVKRAIRDLSGKEFRNWLYKNKARFEEYQRSKG